MACMVGIVWMVGVVCKYVGYGMFDSMYGVYGRSGMVCVLRRSSKGSMYLVNARLVVRNAAKT